MTLLELFSKYRPTVLSNGQIRMMCPFRENHPDGSGRKSFFVSPEINAYHCFSCGWHGNLAHLLTKRFKVSLFDALEMVNLTKYVKEDSPVQAIDSWDIDQFPDEFIRRGYTKDTLAHFRVGMKDGAIVIPYYDSFTTYKTLLGCQRRWYYPTRRVVNSTGFSKGDYLYNSPSGDYVIVVEGQSDVWRLYQYGYNATALLGVTVSDTQAALLQEYRQIYLALDNDTAGREGTERVYDKLRNHCQIKLVPYTSKDPGESSQEEWDNAFFNSTDYAAYAFDMSSEWDGYLRMRRKIINR